MSDSFFVHKTGIAVPRLPLRAADGTCSAVSATDGPQLTTDPADFPPIIETPPIPRIRTVRLDNVHYAVTTIHGGRLGAHTPLKYLGWLPGQPITAELADDVIFIRPARENRLRVSAQGYIILPVSTYRHFGLANGLQVLVAASPATNSLLVCSTGTLTHLLPQVSPTSEPS